MLLERLHIAIIIQKYFVAILTYASIDYTTVLTSFIHFEFPFNSISNV